MTSYYQIKVSREVFERLTAKKRMLEGIYKRDVTWSRLLSLPAEKGVYERVTADDIKNDLGSILAPSPAKVRGLWGIEGLR